MADDMTEKVFVPENNIATFVCPECNASKARDVTKYKNILKAVRLKIKCGCGHSYSAVLERRQTYRKKTSLRGKYKVHPREGLLWEGMTVVDVSRGGLNMSVKQMPHVKVGDVIVVEFHLDDKKHSLIKKEIIVRRLAEGYIHGEFSSIDPSDPSDKALGFYLF